MYLENININNLSHPLYIHSLNPTTHAVYENTEEGERIVYTGSLGDCIKIMEDIDQYILKNEMEEKQILI